MTLPSIITILLVQLWLLAALVLSFHLLSRRHGLWLVAFLLGTLTATMHTPVLGSIRLQIGGSNLVQPQGSFILFPVILLGLLTIYIVNGTQPARRLTLGLVMVMLVMGIIGVTQSFRADWAGGSLAVERPEVLQLQVRVASVVALLFDVIVMTITYQLISNLRAHHPSRTAAILALLAAACTDALVFPLFAGFQLPELSSLLLIHLAGKSIAVLSLWPFLFIYLGYIAPGYPDSSATSPRAVLDIFSTSQQSEARAQLRYSLLRIVSQIDQIIVHANNAQALLEKACQLLVTQREYALVWVGLFDPQEGSKLNLRPAAQAGANFIYHQVLQPSRDSNWQATLDQLLQKSQAVFFQGLPERKQLFQAIAGSAPEFSAVAFPMRHDHHTLGALIVYAQNSFPNESEEIELLQDLADDLAHALISLDARQQQSILQTAAENMLDGLFVADLNGKILYANPAIASMLGNSVQELEGRELREVFSSEDNMLLMDHQITQLLEDQKTEFDLTHTRSDGKTSNFAVRATLTLNALKIPAFVVLNLHETTRSRQYTSRLLTLNRFATDLVQEHDIDSIVERLLLAGKEILQADAASVYLFRNEKGADTPALTGNLPGITMRVDDMPGEAKKHFQQALYVTVSQPDETQAELLEWLQIHGLHGVLFLPIRFQEQHFGTLAGYYQQDRNIGTEELQLGLTLAYTMAIAIQNARLYQAEHSQRRFSEALAQGAAALNSSLDLNLVLDQILFQTIHVIECRSINLMLIDENMARVVRHIDRQGARGIQKARVETGLPLGLPTLQRMVTSGKPIIIADTDLDPAWSKLETTSWIASYAGAPLQVQGQTIGFLNLNSDQAGFFSNEITGRLQAFADTAAAAIQNARLYEDRRLRAEELTTLLEAATVVSTSLDINHVLDVVAEQMTKALNIRGCAISDYDPIHNVVQLRAKFGPEAWWQDPRSYQPYHLDDYPVTHRVMQSRTPISLTIDDPSLDETEREYMQSADIRTYLMLPLYTQDRTLGLVEIIDDVDIRIFTPREIDLARALAAQAAIAIENASLYQKAQNYTTELEERVTARTTELSTAKDRIERILVSVPDAIIVLDDNYHLVQANPAGEKLLVLADQEGIDLFSPELLASMIKGESPGEHMLMEIQDRYYQALASALPGKGYSTGLVIVLRDVTHFRELDQMKDQFVSDVSHELRTPLTNLSLYLDLLSSSRDDFNNQKFLTILHRETARLTYLIEDLLTISRLEAGKVQMKLQPIDVNQLVFDLVDDRTQMAISRRLALTCTPAENLPQILADPRLLTQVLSNLLTNALNYTPTQRTIHVHTEVEQQNAHTWVKIHVSDTGLGIPEEEMQHLFTRFFRGSTSQTSAAPGTGLGLAISKEIMDRLNGRITVASHVGQGTTFSVWLPAVL